MCVSVRGWLTHYLNLFLWESLHCHVKHSVASFLCSVKAGSLSRFGIGEESIFGHIGVVFMSKKHARAHTLLRFPCFLLHSLTVFNFRRSGDMGSAIQFCFLTWSWWAPPRLKPRAESSDALNCRMTGAYFSSCPPPRPIQSAFQGRPDLIWVEQIPYLQGRKWEWGGLGDTLFQLRNHHPVLITLVYLCI